MKKIFIFLIAVFVCVCLIACSGNDDTTTTDGGSQTSTTTKDTLTTTTVLETPTTTITKAPTTTIVETPTTTVVETPTTTVVETPTTTIVETPTTTVVETPTTTIVETPTTTITETPTTTITETPTTSVEETPTTVPEDSTTTTAPEDSTTTTVPEDSTTTTAPDSSDGDQNEDPPSVGVEGLEYTLSDDKQYYIITGIGKCTEANIVIPSEYKGLPVTSIASYCFRSCRSIESVVIPDSITYVGSNSFEECKNLKSVTIGNGITKIESQTFKYCSKLADVKLSEGIITIGEGAFANCQTLEKIDIPDSVEYIEDSAFYFCRNLKEAKISSKITYIGTAFVDCDSLGEWDNGVCYYCNWALTTDPHQYPDSITLRDGTIGIASNFFNSTSIKRITIPSSLKYVCDNAFRYSSSLTGVYISDMEAWLKIDFIGSDTNPLISAKALYLNGSPVTELKIPNGIKEIKNNAFTGCDNIKSVVIPNSVTSIGDLAFSNCDSIKSIVIPDSVTYLGNGAFSYCRNLRDVTLSKGLTAINENTFAGCIRIWNIVIPESVTTIGSRAFEDCHGLLRITLPKSLTKMGLMVFPKCYKLVEVYNPSFSDIKINYDVIPKVKHTSLNEKSILTVENDLVFMTYNDEHYFMEYIGDGTTVSLPSKYKGSNYSVYKYAFAHQNHLTNVVIPNGVKHIGENIFIYSSSLESVSIPFVGESADGSGATSFDYYFNNNEYYIPKSLTKVIITGGSSLDRQAFYNCAYIKSVTIAKSIKKIDYDVFSGCSALESVIFEEKNGWYEFPFGFEYDDKNKINFSYPNSNADILRRGSCYMRLS